MKTRKRIIYQNEEKKFPNLDGWLPWLWMKQPKKRVHHSWTFFWKWNSKQKELLKQTYANYKLIIYNWIVFFYFFICIFSVFLVLLFMIQTLQLYQKIQIPCIHTKQDLRWWQIINVLPTVPERERERDERFHLFVPTTALISSGIEKKLLAHLIDHYGCVDIWWWWFSFLSFFFLFASLIQWQFTF